MAMPVAWQAGYDWAYDKGEFTGMDCGDAIEAHGWAFGSKESELFLAGAQSAQNEQFEGL